jgi:hypothetical protein
MGFNSAFKGLMSGLEVEVNQYFRFEFNITEYRMSLRHTSSLSALNLTTPKNGYSASVEVLIAVSLNVKFFWDVKLLCSTRSS